MQLFNKIKWAIQRASRGYSDNDVTDLHYWLIHTLVPALEQYSRDSKDISTPTAYTNEQWGEILDKMVLYFKASDLAELTAGDRDNYLRQAMALLTDNIKLLWY